MSGRDPDAPIPADFQCDYAEPGERACPAWRCDCFVATHPDDPFGLHPEDFSVHMIQPDGSCWISVAGQGHLPCMIHVREPDG